jgi:hypothetical protein
MRGIVRLGLTLVAGVLASSCLHSPLDENWGKSYEAQVVWQTADPEAPASREPLEGLDPETGKRVAERYYEGQEKQRQREAPAVTIGEF